MKKILSYIILVAGIAFTGCEEDLELINPNVPTLDVFWSKALDAEQGVNAIYSTSHRGGFSRWMPILYISRSDVGYSASPWADLANAIDKFIQPDYNFEATAFVWTDLYVGISRANQVITYVPDIEMDDALKQRLLGEAHFLRGLFYYHLVTLWGNVPLMLEPSALNDLPATAAQAEVWAQVVEDLTFAANALPAVYPNIQDLGRATKGAANAMLAKAYMQQQNYQAALEPLQWLVEGEGAGIYGLMPDYRDNFLVTTENNIESVFEWQFAENPTEFTDNDAQTPDHNYGTSIAQFMAPAGIGWSDVQAHRWPIEEFLEEQTVSGERDPRLAATYIFDFTDERGPEFTMVYGETFAQRNFSNPQAVWFRKFLNDHWKNGEGYRSPNNWRFIRYADVLLMYAEALNATGNTAGAYQYVDRVRERAGLAPLSEVMPNLDQQAFLDQLKHERLLELAGEGHRWNDLMRWGDLGPDLADRDPAFANFVPGRHELLPIPQRDLDANPNMEQNPGW